ncbi:MULTISPECIES: DUF4944 domain-containing protein [Heyndrickxia]|uniref:Uncharacterized protein n=3 Tax=Bacillaceae TaxID=186817 RepID=A0A150KIA2_HEYCO|nr:DUF4944 domain-containing protein [Heyndrickxia coagulans]AEH54834.1 hypothetical protein BCO26_2778 [Heyndrickxia coagulans 2-6]AJH77870.1 hypothetical protein BF29_2024 [Heyndrickxia coagulans DSM 1 = ATCC 7050]KYC73031.1 hypothetical protein B4099_1615 [Heyndrickxia coagulans]MCR2847012.1 YdhH/YoaO family protein [Heyndrickxia coagulans]MDR4224597.1 DUF4944 domain-containing protein [Heyndrickxia coagulans DSM 1 = ATCC 7050]
MKKPWAITGIIAAVVVIGIIVGMVVHEKEKPSYPKWVGHSKSGKWTAVLSYNGEKSDDVNYSGDFIWNGSKKEKNKVSVLKTQYWIGGEMEAGDKTANKEKVSPDTGFVEYTDAPKKGEHPEAVIYWEEDNKVHKEVIELKKQK